MSSERHTSAFLTPPPKSRDRQNLVEVPLQLVLPKTLYLIRHGESEGQAAARLGLDRRHDARLRDCTLTDVGVAQAATNIGRSLGPDGIARIELVVSSPLTRALQTALLAFPPFIPLMVHYDLREVGSRVPENVPRSMTDVLLDLDDLIVQRGDETSIDWVSTQPPDWPRDYSPRVCRHDKIRNSLLWFARRPERHIAVVCHYNVIRTLLLDDSAPISTRSTIRPQNASPITTVLTRNDNGQLILSIISGSN